MKHYLKNTSIIIFFSFLFVGCKNAQNTISKENKITNKIDSLLTTLNQNGNFNGNVLVAKKGEILYHKSYGYSNGTKQNSLKLTDRFNIGSIYKEIPAIAIMQLEEKKILKLKDPINKYLKNLPNWSKDITILNLLQYTSGLPKINWRKHKEINDETLMNDLLEIENLKFIPGENYIYTNYSPFLLSKIVESISKKDFIEYTKQNIIKPNKLNHSQFKKSFPYQDRDSMAIPFNNDFKEDNLPFTIKSSFFLFSTTTEDLFKLLKNLHLNKIVNSKSLNLLGKKGDLNIEDMESPLGQVKYKKNKVFKHTHHGTSGNFESIISKDLINKNTIIILTNSKKSNIHSIKNSIEKLLQ